MPAKSDGSVSRSPANRESSLRCMCPNEVLGNQSPVSSHARGAADRHSASSENPPARRSSWPAGRSPCHPESIVARSELRPAAVPYRLRRLHSSSASRPSSRPSNDRTSRVRGRLYSQRIAACCACVRAPELDRSILFPLQYKAPSNQNPSRRCWQRCDDSRPELIHPCVLDRERVRFAGQLPPRSIERSGARGLRETVRLRG